MPKLVDLLAKGLSHGKFWTDAWSLVSGCTPVSLGCKNCWLASWSRRFEDGLVNDQGQFNGTVRMNVDRLNKPLRSKKPRVYAIWSDLFHAAVPGHFLDGAFAVMAMSPHHHFVIVTKRPELAAAYLSDVRRQELADRSAHYRRDRSPRIITSGVWPLPNVTILGTVEDQTMAEIRVPHLLRIAKEGWRVGILAEPLLGPIDLAGAGAIWSDMNSNIVDNRAFRGGLSWVLAGGESGPRARVAKTAWFRQLRDQSFAARIPFLLKSLGEWVDSRDIHLEPFGPVPEGPVCKVGEDIYQRVGKKFSGRAIDGMEWSEVPDVGE